MDTFHTYNNDIDSIEQQRETYVASIGHDLKNPTIAQIRALELCLKGDFGAVEPRQREILEMVLDSCKYMNAMLCSLLTTYKSDNGVIKLANEEVSILDLTNGCVSEIVYLAKNKDITIEINNNANNVNVYGDKIQLKRVIMNLLTNGIKFGFSNTTLKISSRSRNDSFISVSSEDDF